MKLEQTADGSYTLYVPELDEHYHSVNGVIILLMLFADQAGVVQLLQGFFG